MPESRTEEKKITLDAMKIFSEEMKKKTEDGFNNFLSRLGVGSANNVVSAGTYEFNLVTRNRIKLEAAYRGSWVVGAVVDSVAEDMTRAGITVTTNEDKSSDLKDLYSSISKLQISQSLCANEKWGRLYGGSLAILQIEGQGLESPLDLNSIAKGQFKGLVVFDRWQLQPDLNNIIRSGPNMGLPEFYDIVLTSDIEKTDFKAEDRLRVHHSRVIRSVGIELPHFQAITEQMWGESILERMWDRLISFDEATMSSASLIDRANLRTVGIEGLREVIAAGGAAQAGLLSQFEMMRQLQVNEGITLLDKNDTFQSTAYSFSGLSDMMLQFGQQLAGASEIPLVRLFGQSPAGLNATGESDIRMYYDSIRSKQESKLRNAWDLLLRVMWKSVFEKDPPKDLNFQFVPLWQMSAIDKATMAKSNTETIVGAFEAGLCSRPAAMKDLRQLSPESGLFGNISDEDINEAEEEPPPMPEEDPAPQDPSTPVELKAVKDSWLKRVLRK